MLQNIKSSREEISKEINLKSVVYQEIDQLRSLVCQEISLSPLCVKKFDS